VKGEGVKVRKSERSEREKGRMGEGEKGHGKERAWERLNERSNESFLRKATPGNSEGSFTFVH